MSVSPTSKTLNIGETVQLTGTKNPTSASEGTQWTSSNTSVATVSGSGLVTAKAAGTATITFKNSSSTKSATCKITVIYEYTTEYSISGLIPYYNNWAQIGEINFNENRNIKSITGICTNPFPNTESSPYKVVLNSTVQIQGYNGNSYETILEKVVSGTGERQNLFSGWIFTGDADLSVNVNKQYSKIKIIAKHNTRSFNYWTAKYTINIVFQK